MKYYVLVLLMVSVMPLSAENSFKTQGEYLDSNARYRSTRHHHGHRSHTRRIRSSSIYEPSHPSLPAPEVAAGGMATFDWKDQPPIRWTDVDVSAVLKPNDFVNFPPDPAPFKLPPDPPIVKEYDWEDTFPKWYYTLALFAMLSTCHKSCKGALTWVGKRPSWMPWAIWKQRQILRSLT